MDTGVKEIRVVLVMGDGATQEFALDGRSYNIEYAVALCYDGLNPKPTEIVHTGLVKVSLIGVDHELKTQFVDARSRHDRVEEMS